MTLDLNFLNTRDKKLGNAYQLESAASPFGIDAAFPDELEIDEGKMMLVIPVADGNRRDGVGDLLDITGIVTERHRKNAIAYFDHAKTNPYPIGMGYEWDEAKGFYDRTKYTFDINPVTHQAKLPTYFYRGKGIPGVDRKQEYDHALMCEQLFHMAAVKMLGAGSIGYQVIQADKLPADPSMGLPEGLHLKRILMLEGSLVVLPCNMDTISKCLSMPRMCGKRLSPYLIKSLSPHAAPKKAQLGYEPRQEKVLSSVAAGSGAELIEPPQQGECDCKDKKNCKCSKKHPTEDTGEKSMRLQDLLTHSPLTPAPKRNAAAAISRSWTMAEADLDCNGHGIYKGSCGHIIKQCRCGPNDPCTSKDREYSITDRVCGQCAGRSLRGLRGSKVKALRSWYKRTKSLTDPAEGSTCPECGGVVVFIGSPNIKAITAEQIRKRSRIGGARPGHNNFFATCERYPKGHPKAGRCMPKSGGEEDEGDKKPSSGAQPDLEGDQKPKAGETSKPKPQARQEQIVVAKRDIYHQTPTGEVVPFAKKGEKLAVLGHKGKERIKTRSRQGLEALVSTRDVAGYQEPPAMKQNTIENPQGTKHMAGVIKTKQMPPPPSKPKTPLPGGGGPPGAGAGPGGPPPGGPPPGPPPGAGGPAGAAPPVPQGGDPTMGGLPPEGEQPKKYSAQMLEKIHDDMHILLEDYDEMLQHNEHPEIGAHVQALLEDIVTKIEELESLHSQHHPDHEPLGGGMMGGGDMGDDGDMGGEEEEMPSMTMGEEGGGEGGEEEVDQGDMDTMDDEGVPADSGEEEEPTPDEAVEGMAQGPEKAKGKKSLPTKKTKTIMGKQPVPHGDALQGHEGEIPLADATFNNPSNSGNHTPEVPVKSKGMDLEEHEKECIKEAAHFLHGVRQPGSDFNQSHQMQSFHYHRSLKKIAERAQQAAAEPPGGEGKEPKEKDSKESKEKGLNGKAKAAVGSPQWMKQEMMEPEHQEEGGKDPRALANELSGFFHELSFSRDFGDPHRQRASYWHDQLKTILEGFNSPEGGQESIDDVDKKGGDEAADALEGREDTEKADANEEKGGEGEAKEGKEEGKEEKKIKEEKSLTWAALKEQEARNSQELQELNKTITSLMGRFSSSN